MKTADGFVVTTLFVERMKEVYAVLDEGEKTMCPRFDEMMNIVIKRLDIEAKERSRRVCNEMLDRDIKRLHSEAIK